jgi:hypothetical protein
MEVKRGLRKIKNKKGASHFEMIVAFVLFFSFVVFLLIYIKPYKTGTLQTSVVAGLHDSFKEQSETNLSKFFLKANNSNSEDVFTKTCFKISLDENLFDYGYGFTDSLVKKAADGERKTSKLDTGGELMVEGIDVFYYVMISPDFDDSDVDCTNTLDYYELGPIDKKKVISYNGLVEMKNRYENDYENLKKDMEFPEAYDFSVVSDLIIMEGVVPEEGDIVADDFIEEVLFVNGTIINQRFTLKVW